MNLLGLSALALLYFFCPTKTFASNNPSPYPSVDNIAVSCGSSSNLITEGGRVWIGDTGPSSSLLQLRGKSFKSKSFHQAALIGSVPYSTARVSSQEFTYRFPVRPGQKLIRLHFRHDYYKGFGNSQAIFSVKAGHFTLLSNFSTSLVADALGTKYFSKEFCVNIEEDYISITFSPSPKPGTSGSIYSLINAIEIVSIPTGLYFTQDGELGAFVVGQKYRFYIDNSTALETVQRLNVGGSSILSSEDSSMFRKWHDDSNYVLEDGVVSVRRTIKIRYIDTPIYAAPAELYRTARSGSLDKEFDIYNLSWRIPVDPGFRYLIRMHFCELEPEIQQTGEREFIIMINNQIVEYNADVIKWSGGNGIAVYRDYVVMMKGDRMEDQRNLTVVLLPSSKQTGSILNGLELFKLSNPDNNLASMIPAKPPLISKTQKRRHEKKLYFSNKNATKLTIVICVLNIIVYHLTHLSDSSLQMENRGSSATRHLSCQFSLEEIRLSTQNFNPQLLIGSGGYGKVYKGSIDSGTTIVAIKRLKSESTQGENEFWTEIKMLSKLRNQHLVSLIGYCNDGEEMILVYEYMSQGALADHLYKIHRSGKYYPPLSWEQRLKISIGAAQGLYYLHTSHHRAIHRDVKSSNILLDENLVAKISDFGLSKMGAPNDSFSHVSTNVKGTFGYLDPDYFLTKKLTRKSDVYAFGVVLFEVLSGRPAVDIRLDEEQHSLAAWARYCIREGKVDQIIDPSLTGQISQACLKVFVGIAGRCLNTRPQGRPAMADVVMSLELALVLQTTSSMEQVEEESMNVSRIYSDQSDGVNSFDDISVAPPIGGTDRPTSDEGTSTSPNDKNSDNLRTTKLKNKDNGSNGNATSKWWWDPFGLLARSPSKNRAPSPMPQGGPSHFPLLDIRKATNNFHNGLAIGFAGSDSVYKGYMDGGHKVVTIRRSSSTESRLEMARELQSRIEILPSLNHAHVVALIGYCNDISDMIIVYDHMANGTLHDHLHDTSKDPLPWKKRLQICIGAAKGLYAFQATVKQTILHRTFNSTHILLDKHWTAKISDFGLSRRKRISGVPTIVRSTWGYLDSDYIRGEQQTEKSYIYSFGIVLFEVLCAVKASTRWLDEDQVSLAQWIRLQLRSNLYSCIDPYLIGKISPESFRMFVDIASKCILDRGTERPSISEIMTNLEVALKLQENAEENKGLHTT